MHPALRRTGRVLLGIVTVLLGIVALAAIVVTVLTGTDWGHERVRRIALSQLQKIVHGQVSIGRLSGNLLTGMVAHDFSIRDSTGAPFISAEEVSARYGLGALLGKKIWLKDVRLVRPLVVLDKQPGGPWNYNRIFPRDTTPSLPGDTLPGWGDWIKFENVTLVDGRIVVRTPWKPSESLAPAARDSAARAALGGKSRVVVVAATGAAPGYPPYQKVVEMRSVSAKVPLLRLAEPGYHERLARVTSLQMVALPFNPPAAEVRDMRGDFRFNNDSLWWRDIQAVLPASRVSGDGSYALSSGDMMLQLHGAPAAMADLRWLYPRLPSEGQGTLDFVMRWKGTTQEYLATNADIAVGQTRLTGDFGLTLTDTFALHHTDLQFVNFDTRLIEQLVPSFESPRRGTLSGRAAVNGGKHALQVNADVAFADQTAGTSRLAAVGALGFIDGGGLRATNLRLQLRPVQVELAKAIVPSGATVPISGTLQGTAILNGTTNTQLVTVADVELVDRGTRSRLNGRAGVRLAGAKWFDIDVVARPLSLVEIGRFAPSIGLQGAVTGPIHFTGTLKDLRVDADLALLEGGHLTAQGSLDLEGATKGYDLALGMKVVNLRSVVAKAPQTSLTLIASGRGTGFNPATMQATFAADVATSSWDSLAVDSGSVRVSVANGIADVRKLDLGGAHTRLNASGSFGLVAGRTGQLTYRVAVDSLGAFDRFLPHSGPDTGTVAPRPAVITRALTRARADSARIARATEVERLATGRALPPLAVDTPKAVARTLAGSAYAAGTVRGNIQRFDLRGRLAGENIVVHGNSAHRLRSIYAWTNARTPQSAMAVAVQGDTVSAMGFGFDSVDARLSYANSRGHAEVLIRQNDQRDFGLKGDYILDADNRELRLAALQIRLDSTTWQSTRPAVVHWQPQGIEVQDLELRNGSNGRVYANGLLPTNGTANFELAVDNFEVADVLDLLQSDVPLRGLATLHGTVRGTLAAPSFRGAFGLATGQYGGTTIPELHGTFGYADRVLVSHLDMTRKGGAPMAVADGRLPVNLALSGVTGSRLLDAPATFDLVADSLPLELINEFTDAVSDVGGVAAGRIAMRGTFKRPALTGGLILSRGGIKLASTGMKVNDVVGSVRMLHDTVYVDSIVGDARGEVRLSGSLAVGSWREPAFNLYLVTHNAELLNNQRGRVRADVGLALRGPFNRVALSGQVNVTQGVIQPPEPTGRHVISAGDPDLFNVVDTALMADEELFPTTSPLVRNLRADVTVNINRSTWVRTKDANVEIFTDYPITVRLRQSTLALTGAVGTDRGEYTFLSKRFAITRGSATFVGGRDLNPTLQVTGEYQVAMASGPAMNVRVLIGGTLRRPKLSLETDAQPPRSQSELLSLLAFGRSTTSLLQPEGSSVASLGSSGDLVGAGASIAMRRLTGVALGVLVDEAETELGKGLGADQFNIIPGESPELISGTNAGFRAFVADTRIEAGKYLNPRTFLGIQTQAGLPGARLEYRTPTGWRYNAFTQPTLILKEPSLSGQGFRSTQSFGGFVIREWRF